MEKRIKVLHTAPLGSGGITSFVLNTAEAIDNKKIQIDFLTFYDRKEFAEDRAIRTGGKKYIIPINRYKNPIVRTIYKFFKTISVIRKSGADILHLNTSNPHDVFYAIAAKIGGVKRVFFHSHHSGEENTTIINKFLTKNYKRLISLVSDCNLACSLEAAKFLYTKRIIDKSKYKIISNGIHTKNYCFNKEKRDFFRKQLGIKNEFVIGHVGRFIDVKNHVFLVDIFKEYYMHNPNSILLLIGEGPLENKTKEYVKNLGISDKVIFYGTTDKIPDLLQVMDCFVLPSLHEGLPVSGIEAQAAGLPLVVSDTITKELNISGTVHYVSLNNNALEWVEVINKCINGTNTERAKYNKIVEQSGFDIYCTAEQLTNLYYSSLK